MMNFMAGKTVSVAVYFGEGTSFDTTDSIFAYAIRGNIKRRYDLNTKSYYGFDVYPSQIRHLLREADKNKVEVIIMD